MDIRSRIAQAEQGIIPSLSAATQPLEEQDRTARFGTWANWDAEDIRYLLDELRVGHGSDCGDTVPGYALAMDSLHLVLTLDFARGDREEMVFGGIRKLADTLSHLAEAEDSRDLCEQIIALVDTFRAERKARVQLSRAQEV